MRKLNEKRIQSMSGYLNRRYDELWKAGALPGPRHKEAYKAKCEVMRLSTAWLFERRKEITIVSINGYADTMEEVLGMEERSNEYKDGWHEAVKEVEGFMKWMLEWQGIGED